MNVTGWPNTDGLAEEARDIRVPAMPSTTCDTAEEVLVAKFVVPA